MLDQESNDQEGRKRTERNVMINVQRHLLPGLDFVDTFQDGQSMPDTVDAHFFQFFMLQRDECFANNSIFCETESAHRHSWICGYSYLEMSRSIAADPAMLRIPRIHPLSIPR